MKQDKVLWLGLFISTFLYAGIIYTLHGKPEGSFDAAVQNQLTLVLYGLAFMTFVAALVLPSVMRSHARVKMIVAMALFEACAIYGLLAAFLVRDWRVFLPTWFIALIGMIRMYPSDEGTAVNV